MRSGESLPGSLSRVPGPRSSGDRAPPSGGGSAGSNPVGGTTYQPGPRSLLPHVIRYNGSMPTKLTSWPKYEHYVALERFQTIALALGLPAATPEEGVESYARAVETLRDAVGIESSFQAQGVAEDEFIGRLDELAMNAYEDQCAPANPRLPMLADMKDLMTAAYYGTTIEDVRSRREQQDGQDAGA